MKINELLVESHQQLDEGPFGTAVGKLAGGVAKGVGAVAGGVAGMGKAFKKGYQSGKATVAGDPDPNAKPAAATDPAADDAAVGGATSQPSAGDVNKAGPAGTVAAKPLQGDAKKAADKTAAATADQDSTTAGQTMYATVKANIDKLDQQGKKQLLQLLQKSMTAPAPEAEPEAEPAAGGTTTKDQAGGTTTKDQAGGGAMGNMANQLGAPQKPANTMANAPVSKTNVAKPGNPNAAPEAPAPAPAAPEAPAPEAPAADPAAPQTGGKLTAAQQAAMKAKLQGKRAAGQTAGTTASGFKQYTKDASSQRVVGANKDGSPKIQQIKASKNNYGNALSEALAQRVEMHKQKMFESSLANGTSSMFRKK